MQKFMSYEPADGYNITSKYRWVEQNGKFSVYYARCYPPAEFFDIEVLDPASGEKKLFNHIASLNYDNFVKSYKTVAGKIPGMAYTLPAQLKIDTLSKTAVLTINSFSNSRYKATGMKFHKFIDSAFTKISAQGVKHLVIDVRKNGGGSEGYEDYLLAYMIDKDYLKYKYVQASAFTYSFYRYTDYKDDYKDLDKELKEEHYLEKDGRVLRKAGVEEHEKPKPNPFEGDIYILINGLTYSGGSEFTSLARNHTNAVFIGEETGGGYYGNTSGIRITLKLPNSKLEIGIPILKFVVDTPKDNVPFGHGTLPDYEIEPTISQFLTGYDAEMEMAKQLIVKK
jgi:C-terminal processing protease CtpA/Prc